MRITCESHANHVRITCESRANHVRITCESRANHVRITCESRANHVRITCESRANLAESFLANAISSCFEFRVLILIWMLDYNGLHACIPLILLITAISLWLKLCTSGLLEGVEVARASFLQCLNQQKDKSAVTAWTKLKKCFDAAIRNFLQYVPDSSMTAMQTSEGFWRLEYCIDS